jgi:hypothetical protein
MSVNQAMIWTVCPFGETVIPSGKPGAGTYLNFSVIVSPRLQGSGGSHLKDYPDWSTDGAGGGRAWADTVKAIVPTMQLNLPGFPAPTSYPVRFAPAPSVEGILFGSQAPDASRWTALFPPNTVVTPYVFQGMEDRAIRSAPAGTISNTITSLYGGFGVTSPAAFPLYKDLVPASAFGALGFEQDNPPRDNGGDPGIPGDGAARKAQLNALLDATLASERAVPYDLAALAATLGADEPEGAARSLAFLEAKRFLQRDYALSGAPVDTNPQWDFHQILGAVASQPSLMRVLGLVLDLQVGPVSDAVLTAWQTNANQHTYLTSNAFVSFDPSVLTWPPGKNANQTDTVAPPTVTLSLQGLFKAKPRNPNATDHFDRMLKLGDEALFPIIRIDHDNAAIKTMQLADNVTRSRQAGKKQTLTTPDRFALPALRTGGFAIARSGRAVQMAATLDRQSTDLQDPYFNGQGAKSPLYEEDITRGYRFDVFSKDDPHWRSLMWRQGQVTVGSTDPLDILEEDTIVPAPTTAGITDSGDLYLQETLARWDGWSLAVPRIGTPFYDPKTETPPPNTQGSNGFNLTTQWAVPQGTPVDLRLPRLRFGYNYQLRARAVDLAGNSLTVAAAPQTGIAISRYHQHLRYEPVPAPRMLLLDPPLPGASEEVLVVRSETGTTSGNRPLDTDTAIRLVVPPSTSVTMAEQHRALDLTSTGHPLDSSAARYADLADRDATTLEDLGQLVDPTKVHSQTNPYVYPPFLDISYLPEYIGSIGLIRNLPLNSHQATVAHLPFVPSGNTWPNLEACRVVLRKGSTDWSVTQVPTGSPQTSQLNLTLDVGDMVTCLMNCKIDFATLENMALWEHIQAAATAQGLTATQLQQLQDAILAGEHWMFTPWRTVRFVHAVRTPLLKPKLFLEPSKSAIGQTFAEFAGFNNALFGTVEMSRKSTARIDVNGTWTMPIDTGTNTLEVDETTFSTIKNTSFAAHAFGIDIARVGVGKRPDKTGTSTVPLTNFENFDQTHQFHDTKFRAVNYQATATSFYVEYFRKEMTLDSSSDPIGALRNKVVTPGVAFEASTVKLLLVGTDNTDPHDPKIETRPLVEAPAGTPVDANPAPGDFIVTEDPTLNTASDPLTATAGTIQILDHSPVASSDVKGTPVVVFSYVEPTIHTFSKPAADGTTSQQMHIPNSARPAAPHPLYVIPAYRRVQSDEGTVTRTGGTLRIYLNRPWWSSGDQERLGVVCWHAGASTDALPPDDLAPYVTQWGFDPIHLSRKTLASATKQPTPDCFPFATASRSDGALTIDEIGTTVDVAGHNVQYDKQRDLWYCDIRVTSPAGHELESYTPFIRFALARYQPTSIPDAHLSKVVVVDYAQLAPNRHVTVTSSTFGSNGTYTVTVAGYAPVTTDSPAASASRMRVTVEVRDEQIPDDNLAWKPLLINGSSPISTRLKSSVSNVDVVTWTGSIVVPGNTRQAARLTIEEFELLNGSPRLAFCESVQVTHLAQ